MAIQWIIKSHTFACGHTFTGLPRHLRWLAMTKMLHFLELSDHPVMLRMPPLHRGELGMVLNFLFMHFSILSSRGSGATVAIQ